MLNRSIISGLAALAGLLPLAQAQTAPATAVIEAREVDVTYPAEATVEAVRQATVAAQVAGRVVDVRVDAGQRVKAGELLMRLDAREAAENLAGAQAQAIQAKASLERSRSLFEKKFISQAALDKAEADYKAAAAQAGAAGAGLSHGSVTAP
ncbi:MAG TPA: biotin/lipoyl-binding protein, partial [Rhodocyclaceae bacterium]|nr:biotin/lipoyl-binding protein [Rhodocyclaceae bacterium]